MRILGLDAGVASVGWALLEVESEDGPRPARGAIVAAGVWMFDPAEERTRGGRRSKSAMRRAQRSQRRTLRRRRQRMNEIRRLFHRHGLLPAANRNALHRPGLDPWKLRTRALGRPLSPVEFAVALGHIARRRGFKSNAKSVAGPRDCEETSKMKQALSASRAKLARFETPARLISEDEGFRVPGSTARRFRNRAGDFARLQHRDDLAQEVGALFRAQRRLDAPHATAELEAAFSRAAFFQRPLGDRFADLGPCPFEPDQRRTSKHGYSFELFRCLARLDRLGIDDGGAPRRLTAREKAKATQGFGETPGLSYADLRRVLDLAEGAGFPGVARADEARRDVVARGGAAAGTHLLRREICAAGGEGAWSELLATPERLDAVAEALTFRASSESIRGALQVIGLTKQSTQALLTAAEAGVWDVFTGAGRLSAKAARNLIAGLRQGLSYDAACRAAGYDPASSRERRAFDVGAHGKEALRRIIAQERISEALVGSPTARKALIEAVKQVKAIVERHGVPDRIHVEMAREIGKSAAARRDIEYAALRRAAEEARSGELFREIFGRAPRGGDAGAEEMLRFELWREQKGRCLYTDAPIEAALLLDRNNRVQIDHILPWSRFGDDSYANKTLCLSAANHCKRDFTPAEWFAREKSCAEWRDFAARVNALDLTPAKKRNLLLGEADATASKFRERNLNDTRWVCRLLAEALQTLYPPAESDGAAVGVRRVFARPGALTARLRRAFGLQSFKTTPDGARRADDRHHALDAIVVAATSEAMLQRATRLLQRLERDGGGGPRFSLPWPGFREAALRALDQVVVARAERKRARGKAHDATLLQIAVRDGKTIVYERKNVADLKLDDLDRIKDPERNAAYVATLRAWIEAGKPAAAPPRSPRGDPIRKLRLATTERVNLPISTGNPARPASANRGEMARVDVFRKAGPAGAWRYHFVPVYRHDVVAKAPPEKAMRCGDEADWPRLDASYAFLWALHPMSLIEVTKPDGETIRGYFRGLDRGTGALSIGEIANAAAIRRGIGARKLLRFRKLQVDRLGGVFAVEKEPRLWRGKIWEERDAAPESPHSR